MVVVGSSTMVRENGGGARVMRPSKGGQGHRPVSRRGRSHRNDEHGVSGFLTFGSGETGEGGKKEGGKGLK